MIDLGSQGRFFLFRPTDLVMHCSITSRKKDLKQSQLAGISVGSSGRMGVCTLPFNGMFSMEVCKIWPNVICGLQTYRLMDLRTQTGTIYDWMLYSCQQIM